MLAVQNLCLFLKFEKKFKLKFIFMKFKNSKNNKNEFKLTFFLGKHIVNKEKKRESCDQNFN